jgi:hypothetical protein
MADLSYVLFDPTTITAVVDTATVNKTFPGTLEDYISAVTLQKFTALGGASGLDRYERAVNSSQLSINGDVVVLHGFLKHPTSIRVINDSGVEIEPDSVLQEVLPGGEYALSINLTSYIPFTNYLVILEV